MVSNASDDFPEPLGPVTTVNFPSGRSTSTPLRLFWRAPRISMHPCTAGGVTHSCSASLEPTGDNSRSQLHSQIVGGLLPETFSILLALSSHLLRNDAAKRIEKLFRFGQLRLPVFVIDLEQFIDAFMVNLEAGEIEIVHAGQPTDRRSHGAAASFATIQNPFQHTHVLAEPGPEEISVYAFAEPIHAENGRRIGQPSPDVDPMLEIIADVVAAERQHGHRIATNLADGASGSGCCFRRHGRTEINTVVPIESLKHQWHSAAAASAENDRTDRNTVGSLKIRI